jgi:large repetitive protein
VLDPGALVIARSENDNSGQLVAFDGSNYLVVWSETHEEEVQPSESYEIGDVYSARVSTDGAVLDSDARAISTAPGDQGAHGIAFDGANYFVTWWGRGRH